MKKVFGGCFFCYFIVIGLVLDFDLVVIYVLYWLVWFVVEGCIECW